MFDNLQENYNGHSRTFAAGHPDRENIQEVLKEIRMARWNPTSLQRGQKTARPDQTKAIGQEVMTGAFSGAAVAKNRPR